MQQCSQDSAYYVKHIRSNSSRFTTLKSRLLLLALLVIACFYFFSPAQGSPSELGSAETDRSDSASDRRDILMVNVWQGQHIPDYLRTTLDTIGKNPSLSFLLLVSKNVTQLCPEDGQVSRVIPGEYKNIRVHCVEDTDLHRMFTEAMCETWRCTPEEARDTFQTIEKLLEDPYRMNDLKPIYQAAFQHIWQAAFPGKDFSHWIRLDLDVYVGNFDAYFPWDRLDHDVITFSPGLDFNPRITTVRGYFTAFQISQKMRDHWVKMLKFSTPAVFRAACKNFKSIDEGHQTLTILRDPGVSVYMEPGRVFSDTDARLGLNLILLGDSPDIYVVNATLDRTILSQALEDLRVQHKGHAISSSSRMSFVRYIEMSQECDPLFWIPVEDRYCVSEEENLSLEPHHSPAIIRAPGETRLALYSVQDPGTLGHGPAIRPALGVHLLECKYPKDRPWSVTNDFFASGYILRRGEMLEMSFDGPANKYVSTYLRKDNTGTYTAFSPSA